MRGSLLHNTPGPASCSSSSLVNSRNRVIAGAAPRHQQQPVVAAAAVADAPLSTSATAPSSNSNSTSSVVSPTYDHQHTQPAPASAAAGNSSSSSSTGGMNAATVGFVGAVGSEVLYLNSRRPGQKQKRRARDRSPRPHTRTHLAWQRQFSEHINEYQDGYEGWLHAQEGELLRLQAANAPSTALHYHTMQHDKLKAAWEQKWGPPANMRGNRLSLLPQARAAVMALSAPQGQQATAAAAAAAAAASLSAAGALGPRLAQGGVAGAAQEQALGSAQQQQQQQQHVLEPHVQETVLQQQQDQQQQELAVATPSAQRQEQAAMQALPAVQQQQPVQAEQQQQLPEQLQELHAQVQEQLQELQVMAAQQQQQGAQQQLQPESSQGKKPKHKKLNAAQRRAGGSSSSKGSGRRVSSSALDIPDDTPEQLASAAAATAAASQMGSYSSQSASAAVIVNAICKEPIDRATLDSIEVVFLHLTLQKLVNYNMAHKLPVLADYILARPDCNEHSFGAVFDAYACAGSLHLALATWDRLSAQGVDIGPIGSSALIKACARQMDLTTAKQVFEQLLRRRVTFNSYTYHCLMQLCGSAGSLEDALAVYNLQRLETQPGNLPNSRTYLALVRAMLVAGRCELAQQIFENMLEDDVSPHPALYCNFLTAAGRSGNLGFARYLYQHMAVSLELPQPAPVPTLGLIPASDPHADLLLPEEQQQFGINTSSSSSWDVVPDGIASSTSEGIEDVLADAFMDVAAAAGDGMDTVAAVLGGDAISIQGEEEGEQRDPDEPDLLCLVNALLSAHAQVGALSGAVAIYKQELLGRGLVPDGYTCTALLTAAARLGSSRLAWSQVAEVVELTHHYGITMTTQMGTALINAYRRVRCWEPQQQQQGAAAAAAAGASQRSGGKGRRRGVVNGGDAASTSSSSSSTEAVDFAAEQQQQLVGLQAAWEQEQLAAMGAVQLPGLPAVVCASLHAAQTVLNALADYKLANSSSYVMMMCFLLEQGQVGAFRQLYQQATEGEGIGISEQGWEKLSHAAAECGAGVLVSGLQQRAQQVGRSQQQVQAEALQRERLRARQQQLLQQQHQQQLAAPVAR